ncbi:MAG TPA: zinc finger domain-containing protein [Rhodoglobus sp.]|nr:zinc finger domain-containing protein [Rhodoglobus sp.]HQI65961.1 zinc finger domain-containing protein [Rhodoglobus sp.]
MPEGHSVHRIARQFALHFVGRRVAASSPQGRFAAGAAQLDGHVMTEAMAVGKQMFLEFDNGLWLRVHLGIYGAWDFSGDITADATIASSNGRIGQTNQRGTVVGEHEDSLSSIGAPRRTRLRMAEQERLETPADTFPPEPIGAVRVRLLTDATCADLRGPTACDVLTPDEVQAVIAKLGPDPLVDTGRAAEDRFTATVLKKPTPICLLLMDQSVVSGIGNVYRAEILFRARLNPHIPGRDLPEATVRALWKDWVKLLKIGVKNGQMMTMDGLSKSAYDGAMASRADRHWVYHRTGLPCRVCGTSILMEEIGGRKLYWCPVCQA